MTVKNADILAEIQILRHENRQEHQAITEGVTSCRERISCLETFRDDTKPRLNGMSSRLAVVTEEKAKWSGMKTFLISLAVAAACGIGGFILKTLTE
jgi:hypothetical protein